MPDHVHMCVEVNPCLSLSEFVKTVKQSSSNWIRNHATWFPAFDGWGSGYAAFTYSANERNTVIEYIKNQKEHHAHVSFVDEYNSLMKEFGLDPQKDLFLKD